MKVLLFGLLFFTSSIHANPLVEVESNLNPLQSYKERNHKFSKLLSLGVGYWQPYGFESSKDQNSFVQLFGEGEQINSPEINFWLRKKFMYMDWGVGVILGSGKISSNLSNEDLVLNFQYSGLQFGIWLNQIMEEPYLVPYFSIQQINLSISEQNQGQTLTEITSPSLHMRLGLQLQLSWLEWLSSNRALASFGLQNTFLEGFYQLSSNTINSKNLFNQGSQTGLALSLEF